MPWNATNSNVSEATFAVLCTARSAKSDVATISEDHDLAVLHSLGLPILIGLIWFSLTIWCCVIIMHKCGSTCRPAIRDASELESMELYIGNGYMFSFGSYAMSPRGPLSVYRNSGTGSPGTSAQSPQVSPQQRERRIIKLGAKSEANETKEQGASTSEQCAVCLMDIEAGDGLLRLPCAHRFHKNCKTKSLRPSACAMHATLGAPNTLC